MPWVKTTSTLVHAWFGGQETGNSIADVLFGRVNPSGRLSVTFPERLEDTPAFLTFGKGTREIFYGEGVFIGYRYYEKLRRSPLFYFGHGLSYTTFEYANLAVPTSVCLDDGDQSTFDVTVDIRNTGNRDGHEVVQLYIQDVECAAARPEKELKAFTRVWIPRGQTVVARLTLDKYALSYWDEETEAWLAEKGRFNVIISRSADPRDHVLVESFELAKSYSWSGV
jgi:beta-glucosidase